MRLRTLAICLLTVGLLPLLARGDEWHRSFAVQGEPTLHVETNDGNVQINSWDRPEIDARVVTSGWTIGPQGIQVTPSQNGNEVDLVVRRPHENWNWSWGGRWVRVELTVPRRLTLNARTGDGNLTLAFIGGNLRVHTGDGNVEADNLDAAQFDGTTGDGNIRLSGRFDELTLHSGDGNVRVQASDGSTIASPWTLGSGDGNIDLAVPAAFKAELEARTGDGSITLDLPVTMTGAVSRNNVRGQINGGGGVLAIHTGDGSIHLSRS